MTTPTIAGYPLELLAERTPPCVSLYLPTHRSWPDSQQNAIRYGNLLKTAEQSLRQQHPPALVDELLEPLRKLADDRDFWIHQRDGLALLRDRELFEVIRVSRSVPERAIVADSFHLKPLLRIMQSSERYQVLTLSRGQVRLFEGNRDALDEVPLDASIPRSIADLGPSDTPREPPQPMAASGTGPTGPGIVPGHHDTQKETDRNTEKLFRAVDEAVLDRHSKRSNLPLVLVALPEHQALFRRVSRNGALHPRGVEVAPESLEADALRERVWQAVEPDVRARVQAHLDRFHELSAKQLGSHDPNEVARAVIEGRCATLLIDAERQVPGRLDIERMRLVPADAQAPDVDDALDDLAELALRNGAEVLVLPPAAFPGTTGVAATFRY